MSRERDGYRDNLELLNEAFPEKNLLRVVDVEKFTGLSRNTVLKRFKFMAGKPKLISKADFARQISV